MKDRKLRLITEILAIITICLISFVGIFVQNKNQVSNIVKNYQLGKDVKGYRELIFSVSDATQVTDSDGKVVGNTDNYTDEAIASNSYNKTENKINKEEELNEENYEKTKNIIEKRLAKLGASDYNLSLNKESGLIYLTIPEDDNTERLISNIIEVSNFEIRDSEDKEKVFIKNEDIKKVSSVYNTDTDGTIVYLQIEFNKNGKEKLKEISSGEYKAKSEEEEEEEKENENENNEDTQNNVENTSTEQNEQTTENQEEQENTENNESEEKNENSENGENEAEKEEKTEKKVDLVIDDNTLISSNFEEPIENGTINLSMGKASTDTNKINENLKSTATIATLLNTGKLPITYKISENKYVDSELPKDSTKKAIYICAAVVMLLFVYLILKYKVRGLISAISFVGFLGLYLLLIRYTNVQITLNSVIALIIVSIINFMIVLKILKIEASDEESKNQAIKDTFKQIVIEMIPITLISIVFSFIKWNEIAVFGMTAFWGILLSVIYNYTIVKDMIE